ncbi:VTT domain-containing protein [Candidatus Binatia bacterium]|nr:VTT domain-containing protein [Candidatus Binatia bacterium]
MTSEATTTTTRRLLHSRGLQSALAALLVGGLVIGWVHLQGGPEGIHRRWGLAAPLVWIPMQVVVHVTPLGDFVPWSVLNGSMFGLWLGALTTWLSWMGSASAQYAIGRRTAVDLDWETKVARLPAWLRRLPIGHPLFLIVARQFPLMAGPINVAAGAARVPFARMLWCTAIGVLPPALFLAAVGVGIVGAM